MYRSLLVPAIPRSWIETIAQLPDCRKIVQEHWPCYQCLRLREVPIVIIEACVYLGGTGLWGLRILSSIGRLQH
jgi:hypothetical protein